MVTKISAWRLGIRQRNISEKKYRRQAALVSGMAMVAGGISINISVSACSRCAHAHCGNAALYAHNQWRAPARAAWRSGMAAAGVMAQHQSGGDVTKAQWRIEQRSSTRQYNRNS
jgi:hypothetical protein